MAIASEASSSASVTEENIQAIAGLQAKAHGQRSLAQRCGDAITVAAARESSVAVHIVWFGVWMVLNTGHAFVNRGPTQSMGWLRQVSAFT